MEKRERPQGDPDESEKERVQGSVAPPGRGKPQGDQLVRLGGSHADWLPRRSSGNLRDQD